ncbi:hypothetical protein JCM5353_001480 [Sporobolomyces roseus]
MPFKMKVAILSLGTSAFFAIAQFFPLSLYSVSSLTSLTKRALSDYTPSFVSFATGDASPTDDGSATYLPDIIQASTTMCQSKCHVVSRTLAGCLRSGADYDILKCSCSDTTLARVYTCANCITIDPSYSNGTIPLQNYNGTSSSSPSLLYLSNSSQLYQIRGQPLTIATPTTTLTNPSATSSGNDPFQTGVGEGEEDEEDEEGTNGEKEVSSAATSERGVGVAMAVLGVTVGAVVLVL